MYHEETRDAIANEIFRRVMGKTMGEYLRTELAEYDFDIHVGCNSDAILSRFEDL